RRSGRGSSTATTAPLARAATRSTHRRWSTLSRATTSRLPSRSSPAESSNTTTAPNGDTGDGAAVARILLGVSGGIAAYRAIELARLATRAGHGVRVLMTPTAESFVGRASFEGIVGAPVLVDEFGRDPMRGAFPGEPAPDHDPIGHLELAAKADAFIVAPA